MERQSPDPQENLIIRSISVFRQNVTAVFVRRNQLRKHSVDWFEKKLNYFYNWGRNHWDGLVIGIATAIFIAFSFVLVIDLIQGKGRDQTVQVILTGLLVGVVLGLMGGTLIALTYLLAMYLASRHFKLLASIILFLPLILMVPVYALWQTIVTVVVKLLLLIPLFVLFVVTRSMQLWRGIFYTCPSRECAYRGLPIYVCPKCSVGNSKLWPNLYGLLWHPCVKCGERLPTLELLGRKNLLLLCGKETCQMPLSGKHVGRAPERLVAIVGGDNSGVTNYLLMVVNEIISKSNSTVSIQGEIDDYMQAEHFQHEWGHLVTGMPASKTSQVTRALLLFVTVEKSKFQLYLYEAPGEEYTSLTRMMRQEYLPLLGGFILLVDPLSFDVIRQSLDKSYGIGPTLDDVVSRTIMTLSARSDLRHDGKVAMRVAVVISKADLECVKEQIGDIKQSRIAGERCREAIVRWGGGSAIRSIEHRFEEVAYFACSPLGRGVISSQPTAIQGVRNFGAVALGLNGQKGLAHAASLCAEHG